MILNERLFSNTLNLSLNLVYPFDSWGDSSSCLFFFNQIRAKVGVNGREYWTCVEPHSTVYLTSVMYKKYKRQESNLVASPTYKPVGLGLQIFCLITLPLVIKYPFWGWAKKHKRSKCWWGPCRPTTSRKAGYAPATCKLQRVNWLPSRTSTN